MLAGFKAKIIVVLVVFSLLMAFYWTICHYRDNANACKEQRDKVKCDLELVNNTINDMKVRQRGVAVPDVKASMIYLEHDIASGLRRL